MTDQSGKRHTKISKGFVPALAFAVFGLVGGVLAAFISLQSGADEPRSRSVDDTVAQFMDTAFRMHDRTRLTPYVCDRWPVDDVLRLVDQHARAGSDVELGSVEGSIEYLDQSTRARVIKGLLVNNDRQRWSLELVNEGGWRVCSAALLPDLGETTPAVTPTTPG